ncbi:hypothetical protein [Gluconobacter cerinus]|uniref:hypothetical protein n=1 Tax=Gluconobacter cerinus TaxID=38307 RepID=UPI001B8B5F53|nr:hypothetical protein [Gluconobacter cerinus]MBS1038093.1 hypothetical protein [Gluconobacter cerinus]
MEEKNEFTILRDNIWNRIVDFVCSIYNYVLGFLAEAGNSSVSFGSGPDGLEALLFLFLFLLLFPLVIGSFLVALSVPVLIVYGIYLTIFYSIVGFIYRVCEYKTRLRAERVLKLFIKRRIYPLIRISIFLGLACLLLKLWGIIQ